MLAGRHQRASCQLFIRLFREILLFFSPVKPIPARAYSIESGLSRADTSNPLETRTNCSPKVIKMGSGSSTQGSSGFSASQKRNLLETLQRQKGLGNLLLVSLMMSIGFVIFVCYFKRMWAQQRAKHFEDGRNYRDIESHDPSEDKEEKMEFQRFVDH